MRARLAVAILSGVLATQAPAQSLSINGACVLAQPRDTVDAIMAAGVRAFDPKQRVPPDYVEAITQELVRFFRVPPGLQLAAFTATRADNRLVYPAETMMAEFVLDRSGRLLRAAPVTRSLSPAFDSLAFVALSRASDDVAFPPAPARVRGDSVPFRLVVSVGERVDSGAMLVARLRVPAWRLSRTATPIAPYAQPQYPPEMRRKNIPGEVVLEFVLGTDSTVLAPTVRVARYTDLAFWDEVRKVLPRARFAPAMVGECPIATREQQPFVFSLR